MFRSDDELTPREGAWRDRLLRVTEAESGFAAALRRWFRRGASERSEELREFYDVGGF